ncbi:MAG TPA: hypothetical protein VLW50_11695 [Streptosporangiaceae bacterium]|nr:hypothetical protein [Streptosporangiaceae bacterium]
MYGLGLYRANTGTRHTPVRPDPVDVPVQIVVATHDPVIARRTQLAVDGYAPRLWRREIRAGHWVPHPSSAPRTLDS